MPHIDERYAPSTPKQSPQSDPYETYRACEAMTDEKLAPPGWMTRATNWVADNMMPGPIGRLAKDLPKGPAGFGFGEEGMQRCMDWSQKSTLDRLKNLGGYLKKTALGDDE